MKICEVKTKDGFVICYRFNSQFHADVFIKDHPGAEVHMVKDGKVYVKF